MRAILLTLGGGYIGASALVSSLVLFALQVNVERLPYSMFRSLSGDQVLLSLFGLAFSSAVALTATSVFPSREWLPLILWLASLVTALLPVLFLVGYLRALALINPHKQLNILIKAAEKDSAKWEKSIKKTAPLLELRDRKPSTSQSGLTGNHDVARVAFFQINQNWTFVTERSLKQTFSFVRYFGRQSDYDVCVSALNAVVRLNKLYVQVKGQTFFSVNIFFDNPLTTDRIINMTLEGLKECLRISLSDSDEALSIHIAKTFEQLINIYIGIEYGGLLDSRFHAHLALGYLRDETQASLSTNLTEVNLEVVRILGRCGERFLYAEGPRGIQKIDQGVAVISAVTSLREDKRPIAIAGVTALSNLSFALLKVREDAALHEIGPVIQEIRSNYLFVAKSVLSIHDTPFSSIHSFLLGNYYGLGTGALNQRLPLFVNELCEADEHSEIAKRAVRNLIEWSKGADRSDKELLLLAIEKESHFAIHVLSWLKLHIECLLVTANAAACSDDDSAALKRQALHIAYVFSWLPVTPEKIRYLENFQITETLFDIGKVSHFRIAPEVTEVIMKVLMDWTLSASVEPTGWGILEQGIKAISLLGVDLWGIAADEVVTAQFRDRLKDYVLDQDYADRTAKELRREARYPDRNRHSANSVEVHFQRQGAPERSATIVALADLISPDTQGEMSEPRWL
ncbi:MAG: hypothetical protein CME88_09930 [Hirschia sp.]|nr:hypothetical protein [Hirschia sp.]MBF18686.1 hypothetical protein [Hirschia sp.]|tara:strand:+ start:1949 stop:4006 length:2058 start_codon:yes stop_codon:yes gene_type:complete